jgi:hypothetical protein
MVFSPTKFLIYIYIYIFFLFYNIISDIYIVLDFLAAKILQQNPEFYMAKGLNWSKTEVPKNFENLNGQRPGWWSKTKFLKETLKRLGWLKAGSDKV